MLLSIKIQYSDNWSGWRMWAAIELHWWQFGPHISHESHHLGPGKIKLQCQNPVRFAKQVCSLTFLSSNLLTHKAYVYIAFTGLLGDINWVCTLWEESWDDNGNPSLWLWKRNT